MKKNLICLITAAIMTLSLMPNITFAAYEGDLEFDSSTGTITSCDENASGKLVIPSEINGVAVRSISESAFYHRDKLTDITIPDSVTSIGNSAFEGCASLNSVTLPSGLTSVSDGLFYECTSLAKITLPDSVTTIGEGAFRKCKSLESVNIPDKTTAIALRAFDECESLKSVDIPASVASIGNYTFEYCLNLTSINVDSANSNYCSENGVLFTKDKTELLQYPPSKQDSTYDIPYGVTGIRQSAFYFCQNLTGVTFPNGLKTIERYAFYNCSNLTNPVFPDSLSSIGDYAFYGCSSMTEINIPRNVTEIYDSSFTNCRGLTSINADSANSRYASENGVLFDKNKTRLIRYPENKSDSTYTILDSVQTIGFKSFSNCQNLTDITMGNDVLIIDNYAFQDCTGLTSIDIPASAADIADNALSGCVYLKEINVDSENQNYFSTDGVLFKKDGMKLVQYPARKKGSTYIIPDGTEFISQDAFAGSRNLKCIAIPENTVCLCDFGELPNISDIYYAGSEEQWKNNCGENLFYSKIHCNSDGIPTPEIHTAAIAKDNNEYTFNASLTVPYNCAVIVALYSDGVLIDFYSQSVGWNDTQCSNCIIADEADSAKLFIWDSASNMIPLLETPIEIPASQFVTAQ